MQFALSLDELCRVTSPSALLCTVIAHIAALGAGLAGEMMHRTISHPGGTSAVCLWLVTPEAAEKMHYSQVKHSCTFSRATSKVSLAMAVHTASQAPLSSCRWSWAGLPQCWQAQAARHSHLLPRDTEGQCWAPTATCHTCTGQFGSDPLCDGCKSIYELQSRPVKHIILTVLPLLQK